MQNEWEIKIGERPGMRFTDIYIYREARASNGVILWTYDSEKNTVTEKTFEDSFSGIIPASFSVPSSILNQLLQVLIEKGHKPKEQSFIEGKLEATENHLSDIRQLLKLPKR